MKQLPKYVIRLKFMRESNMPKPVKTSQPIFTDVLDLYPLKLPEKQRLFHVFKGYTKEDIGWK